MDIQPLKVRRCQISGDELCSEPAKWKIGTWYLCEAHAKASTSLTSEEYEKGRARFAFIAKGCAGGTAFRNNMGYFGPGLNDHLSDSHYVTI